LQELVENQQLQFTVDGCAARVGKLRRWGELEELGTLSRG